jgi:protein SCO1/2
MIRRHRLTAALAFAALLLAAALPAAAQRPAEAREAARAYFTDVELQDQNGETVHLYSDLMDGHVVVISSMFTTCAAICPVLGQKIKAIQEAAGDRLGKDVHILSITVDPGHDTPAVLREYAKRFEAQPGWHFLTGSEENVRFALAKLGFQVETKDDHSTVVLLGNEKTGLWKKANGLAGTQALVELFDSVMNDTGAAAGGSRGSR